MGVCLDVVGTPLRLIGMPGKFVQTMQCTSTSQEDDEEEDGDDDYDGGDDDGEEEAVNDEVCMWLCIFQTRIVPCVC